MSLAVPLRPIDASARSVPYVLSQGNSRGSRDRGGSADRPWRVDRGARRSEIGGWRVVVGAAAALTHANLSSFMQNGRRSRYRAQLDPFTTKIWPPRAPLGRSEMTRASGLGIPESAGGPWEWKGGGMDARVIFLVVVVVLEVEAVRWKEFEGPETRRLIMLDNAVRPAGPLGQSRWRGSGVVLSVRARVERSSAHRCRRRRDPSGQKPAEADARDAASAAATANGGSGERNSRLLPPEHGLFRAGLCSLRSCLTVGLLRSVGLAISVFGIRLPAGVSPFERARARLSVASWDPVTASDGGGANQALERPTTMTRTGLTRIRSFVCVLIWSGQDLEVQRLAYTLYLCRPRGSFRRLPSRTFSKLAPSNPARSFHDAEHTTDCTITLRAGKLAILHTHDLSGLAVIRVALVSRILEASKRHLFNRTSFPIIPWHGAAFGQVLRAEAAPGRTAHERSKTCQCHEHQVRFSRRRPLRLRTCRGSAVTSCGTTRSAMRWNAPCTTTSGGGADPEDRRRKDVRVLAPPRQSLVVFTARYRISLARGTVDAFQRANPDARVPRCASERSTIAQSHPRSSQKRDDRPLPRTHQSGVGLGDTDGARPPGSDEPRASKGVDHACHWRVTADTSTDTARDRAGRRGRTRPPDFRARRGLANATRPPSGLDDPWGPHATALYPRPTFNPQGRLGRCADEDGRACTHAARAWSRTTPQVRLREGLLREHGCGVASHPTKFTGPCPLAFFDPLPPQILDAVGECPGRGHRSEARASSSWAVQTASSGPAPVLPATMSFSARSNSDAHLGSLEGGSQSPSASMATLDPWRLQSRSAARKPLELRTDTCNASRRAMSYVLACVGPSLTCCGVPGVRPSTQPSHRYRLDIHANAVFAPPEARRQVRPPRITRSATSRRRPSQQHIWAERRIPFGEQMRRAGRAFHATAGGRALCGAGFSTFHRTLAAAGGREGGAVFRRVRPACVRVLRSVSSRAGLSACVVTHLPLLVEIFTSQGSEVETQADSDGEYGLRRPSVVATLSHRFAARGVPGTAQAPNGRRRAGSKAPWWHAAMYWLDENGWDGLTSGRPGLN
ncbi:uncharacterized protein BXZ73DRAFT_78825 [Epithele typhae]|uniref:uncharacterized protein n=1 Tax=Epithele typhae TaxID=378194 RepID=UPI0020081C6A|nr:uncharacterized protein BXZ73DRAFT_78825 [Epithele typhae]KAH9926324.1 hypothetical protein BXZ73DRAFT_78825 [Epithele typhae]